MNGNRRYVAVAPDDGRKDTVWGYGFLDNMPGEEGTLNNLVPCKGTFYPSISLPVSADTNPDSANLDYYDPGMAIAYDSYIISNGYYWISYITSSGARRYVAITPNDYELDTIWGTGFRGKIIKV